MTRFVYRTDNTLTLQHLSFYNEPDGVLQIALPSSRPRTRPGLNRTLKRRSPLDKLLVIDRDTGVEDGSSMKSGTEYSIRPESFESLKAWWLTSSSPMRWDCLFVLPPWLESWWSVFGPVGALHLRTVRSNGASIGFVPLCIHRKEAFLIGSNDVCDYSDFVIAPGKEQGFFEVLIDDVQDRGVEYLNLGLLRPDSTVLTHLVDFAQCRGYKAWCEKKDVSLELDLPSTWEAYLGALNRKQRHEVRRKMRRVREAGILNYRVVTNTVDVQEKTGLFLDLFRQSNGEKATFMNATMESFFGSIARGMAAQKLLRLGIMELDGRAVAAVMCFDYRDTMYLYNSGYDPAYGSLGVGLVCKILAIKDSIERGRNRFDFLKGAEEYKYRLGGKETPLYACQIDLT